MAPGSFRKFVTCCRSLCPALPFADVDTYDYALFDRNPRSTTLLKLWSEQRKTSRRETKK